MIRATTDALDQKAGVLSEKLCGLGSALVAYSGGVDSGYLSWAARQVLGDQMLAVLADSPSLAAFQKRDAIQFARDYGIPLEVIRTDEFDNSDYTENAPDRCFHCKDELFGKLAEIARERGLASIIYGVNADDTRDFRPGHRAAAQYGVRSPLLEAGLNKAEIRELARQAGLPVWDRPASACLSSRIPYGTPVTIQNLKKVEDGEDALRQLGFRQFRVRHHGELVRIEIAPEELPKALDPQMAQKFTEIFKKLGYKYVTLDLEGYRTGSLNEVL
ncbi:MAG: TIGR00268 family protein [Acidobacteria bacterium RIFCSPLOWO2_02_FULL_61_28]|nr:MAG: TIGR00268 family protein [Acidobacteria bacterium RIFCSPLOWO2_02_FULL_61_28]